MITIRNEKIEVEEALKNKIEFICSFCNTTPIIYNGNIKMIEHANLQYGKCYLLNKKKDYCLVYVSDCFMHDVVCNYIDSIRTMMNQEFFEDLKSAKRYFKEKCRGKK